MNRKGPLCDTDRRQQLIRTAAPLLIQCPVGHDNPASCPLHDIRSRQRLVRTQWLDQLSEEDLEFLTDYHRVCFAWKKQGTA